VTRAALVLACLAACAPAGPPDDAATAQQAMRCRAEARMLARTQSPPRESGRIPQATSLAAERDLFDRCMSDPLP
jgi:hypothetical protein